ncbi:HNH endonuclease signature motif containing protein [Bradyrhizobium sp. 153]|uniref:HNH endonuclease n=1 Tax=Bradyrhizobium sp. 153 TaxID=2782627 RepID=UPI001FFBF0FD|nr:HNH endonuclease signature motif containing protein [Bradyrhizobium sp. 153]
MIRIEMPAAASDDAYLQKLCGKQPWSPHYALWQAAYSGYRSQKGNPWHISRTAFVPDVSDQQTALYESQSSSQRIVKIRQMQLKSCPMCGSSVTGTVDHYLPKEDFPEFSVMAANLVPACSHCNSGKKGRTFRGTSRNERFLHPYFDSLAGQPLWLTRIIPPYEAARFEAAPIQSLSANNRELMKFHLRHVLGQQFHRNAENLWATYPQYLRDEIGGTAPVSPARARKEIARSLRISILTSGENSWNASFFRGLAENGDAQTYLARAARGLKATPLLL